MIKTAPFFRAQVFFFLILSCIAWCAISARSFYQGTNYSMSPHGAIKIACQNCHNTESWKPIRPEPDFNHRTTRYPLSGMHTKVGCRECHASLTFLNIGMRCAECHADIHRRQMGSNCEQCHSVRGWLQIKQKTNGHENRFPLLGAHAAVQCEGCHKSAAVGLYLGVSTNCVSCHINDFRSAKSPNHQSSGFPQSCPLCHSMASWFPATFNHRTTAFPLTGAHTTVPCASCHSGGKYAGTPTDCYSCHTQDFNNTTNPNHVTAGYSQVCTICHTTNAWTPSLFNHNSTAFPLTGAHTTVSCARCHIGGKYAGTPKDCYSCHAQDFTNAANPNHITAGFSQLCSNCHNTSAWTPAIFNHSSTAFPLTGAHKTVSCAGCHSGGKYAGTPTDCYPCHTKNFTNAINPNHVAAGYPQVCAVCHTTTAWTPSIFNHSSTAFPLTGAHATVPCANCHISGIYAGTPTDCYSCHSKEYTSTTNPNHIAASFPKTCATCHSKTSWSGATFNHTYFPIYSGNHSGQWATCSVCHTNSGDYSVFSCTAGCHAKSTMDSKHKSVSSYVYNSANCYSCHPSGRTD
jgi:predicted CXXCH cytochrome family protein